MGALCGRPTDLVMLLLSLVCKSSDDHDDGRSHGYNEEGREDTDNGWDEDFCNGLLRQSFGSVHPFLSHGSSEDFQCIGKA
jgi:hypothetical protein